MLNEFGLEWIYITSKESGRVSFMVKGMCVAYLYVGVGVGTDANEVGFEGAFHLWVVYNSMDYLLFYQILISLCKKEQ